MILTIDIGNSYIKIGMINGAQVLFHEHIKTDAEKTDLEYTIDLLNILEAHRIAPNEPDGCIISCVVPPLLTILTAACKRVLNIDPVIVNPRNTEFLKVSLKHNHELGSNLYVCSIAAIYEYGAPVIIIDMGTATSIGVIDDTGTYIGGAILPGMQTSVNALFKGASALPRVRPRETPGIYGKNTDSSMSGGAIFGNAGAIDGVLDRIIRELREKGIKEPTIIATGHLSTILKPHFTHEVLVDEELPFKGLFILYALTKEKWNTV